MPLSYKKIARHALPLLLAMGLSGCENQFTDIIDDNWIKKPEVCSPDTTAVSFKKVAYWTPDDNENMQRVKFSSLTHIIYASISVNADGSLVLPDDTDDLEDLVDYAQAASIKVLVSIGDGEDNNFNTIGENFALRKTFVNNVADFVDDYELDGIDFNWQTINSDDESDNLEDILDKLSEKLSEDGKLLSMVVTSGENESQADNVENDMFEYVDFVNVMALDSTDNDGLHASLEDATEAITYWTDRCLIKNKLVLAVPFYSAGKAERSYDYLIRDDIKYACVDESEGRNYNGIPTVTDKTNYAKLYAGGIAMKSLEQDFYQRNNDDSDDEFVINDYSLLNAINQTVLGNQLSVCQP